MSRFFKYQSSATIHEFPDVLSFFKQDCSNLNDENNCTRAEKFQLTADKTVLRGFSLKVNMKLTIMEIELFVEIPLQTCAVKCLERVNCRSFSYK